MTIKTVTLRPSSWGVRDDPGTLTWVTSIGGADMLKAVDADYAVCSNGTGLAADSDSLDARTFLDSITNALPVFEADARAPSVTVRCHYFPQDNKDAAPYVYVFDSANTGAFQEMGPFAYVTSSPSGAWYEQPVSAAWLAANSLFAVAAAGRLVISTIFPSRPASGTPCADLRWNATEVLITYTFGPNTTPAPFDFTDKTGAVGTNVLSNVVNITGIDVPQLVSIAGHASAVFSVNGDAFSAVARNIANGQTLQLRMTAPAAIGATVNCTVTVETRSDAWTVTAGSDVPTNLNPPADLVNVIPGWLVPDLAYGQSLVWQPRGHTAPMPFSFSWVGVSGLQWSKAGSNGPWTDGATAGSAGPFDNIWIRCKAPLGPSQTGVVTLTYASAGLIDTVNISTGAPAFVYLLDLSPIDAFQVALPSGTKDWSPIPSGTRHHVSIAQQDVAQGAVFATQYSQGNAGQWWRKKDGSAMLWPTGSVLVGVDYGGQRVHEHGPLSGPDDAIFDNYFSRDIGGATWTQLPGVNNFSSITQFLNGGAAPGVTPFGWTLPQLFAALKADTFAIALRSQFNDANGYAPRCTISTHLLRVFFRVERPPEGMVWEG